MFAKFLASKASGYIAVAMGSLVLVLALSLWNAERRLDNCKTENANLTADVQSAVEANKSVKATLDACIATNAANATQRDAAQARADAAAIRAAKLAAQLETALENTYVPNDTDCRTLTDPLPDVRKWLCVGTANCNAD